MKSIFYLGSWQKDENIRSTIEVTSVNTGFELVYRSKHSEIIVWDRLPFFALVKLREILEQQDCYLLCNGARKDVYPSGMTSGGFYAYILDFHNPEQKLIHIFGFTNKIEKLCSVDEQLEYRNCWLRFQAM